MKVTKRIIKITAALLAILLLPALPLFLPSQFDNYYTGALDEKVSRLESIEEPKIVVVGGSSVAFGLDSEMLSESLDMPVVNFGLYATLGTKLMLDLSEEHIKKGDIVILAPELDKQTLSLYFSPSTTLRAADGNFSMLAPIMDDHFTDLIGAMWDFGAEKLNCFFNGAADPYGVYNSKNFNEYGDVVYERPANTMKKYYVDDEEQIIDLSPDILDAEFVDYLNAYIDSCKAVGASVYFSYCPMNSLAIKEGSTEESIAAFGEYLEDNINCTFISYVDDYIMEPGYFYDTNFHLNDTGVTRRTATLINDLYLEFGITKTVSDIPEPPPLPEINVRYFDYDPNSEYFTYIKAADGSYVISGVKDEYKHLKELTVPLGYDTYEVSAIAKGAFRGSAVEKVIITEDSNISVLHTAFLEGAENLRELWIYFFDAYSIAPPDYYGLPVGSFSIYIPEGSLYKTIYGWDHLENNDYRTIE